MENYIDDSRIHEGHRQRMRSKLLTHGQRIFDTYELLEMLLYHVIPYKDTNPISKRLLASLGGLDGVLSASSDELTSCAGIGARTADFIQTVGAIQDILGAEFIPNSVTSFTNHEQVGEYFVDYFKDQTDCFVAAMFFDNNMRLLDVKRLYEFDYALAGVKPKAFIDAALSLRASVVISAHNHPCGPFCPTQGDRATHSLISDSLANTGIFHAEHYVVCGDSYYAIGRSKSLTGSFWQTSGAWKNQRGAAVQSSQEDESYEIYPPANATYSTRHFEYFAKMLAFSGVKDTRHAAHVLLSKYWTIENVLCADVEELKSMFSERVAFFIKTIAYATSRRVTDQFACGIEYNRAELAEYLKALFIGDSVEKIYLLLFDSNSKFLGCEQLSEGTVNASEVFARKALEVAFNKCASSVVMAHNHPFGNTDASDADKNFTQKFQSVFSSCDIKLTEHYIISGQLCNMIILNV